jgi:hypothetical protein
MSPARTGSANGGTQQLPEALPNEPEILVGIVALRFDLDRCIAIPLGFLEAPKLYQGKAQIAFAEILRMRIAWIDRDAFAVALNGCFPGQFIQVSGCVW